MSLSKHVSRSVYGAPSLTQQEVPRQENENFENNLSIGLLVVFGRISFSRASAATELQKVVMSEMWRFVVGASVLHPLYL